jgi:hypothetical protein
MSTVHLEDPERMSLLGLILGQVLQRRLSAPRQARWVRDLTAEVVIKSGGMAVTVTFAPGQPVRVKNAVASQPTASMEAPLDVLADLALSRRLVTHALQRRFTLRGHLPTLLRFWWLLRTARPGALSAVAEET